MTTKIERYSLIGDNPITIKELYEWAVIHGLENNYMSDIEGNIITCGRYSPSFTEDEIKNMNKNIDDEDMDEIIKEEFSISIG